MAATTCENIRIEQKTERDLMVVLSFQGWTNLLFVLHFFGIENVFVIQNTTSYLVTLQENTSFDDITFENVMEKMEDKDLSEVIWILEGSSSFIKTQLGLFGVEQNRATRQGSMRFFMLFTDRVRSFNFIGGAQWTKVAHRKDAGGASTTITKTAILPKRSWTRTSTENQRWFLNDFLKSTLRDKRIEPGIAQNVLFSPNKVHDFYQVPCIFAATGWAQRRLSPSETL